MPHIRKATLASVLLHAGLLGVFAWKSLTAVGPTRQQREYIVIEFASDAPKSRPLTEAAATSADIPPTALPDPAATGNPSVADPASAQEPRQSADIDFNGDSAASAEGPGTPGPGSLDPASLQQSIAGLAAGLRSANTRRWMQDCKPATGKREATPDDCPTLADNVSAERAAIFRNIDATFVTWIRGHDRNARLTRELLADMDTLRPLTKQSGLLARLAQERYALLELQYRYLNPDEEAGRHSETVTLATLGPGGITILGGLMSIGFDGTVKFDTERNRGPALPFSGFEAPCDYADGCE